MSASDILLSSVSISVAGDSGAVGAIGSSVTVASATSTSIAGSTSGAAGADGAVGAIGSGVVGSAGATVADSKMPISFVPNWASTAVLNVSIWRSVNVVQHHQRCIDLAQCRFASLLD